MRKRVKALASAASRKAARAAAAAAAAKPGGAATVAAAAAAAAAGEPGADLGAFEVEAIIGARDETEAAAAFGLVTPAGAGAKPRRRPPKAAVVAVSPKLDRRAVARAMRGAPGVSAVVEDRVITIAGPLPLPAQAASAAPGDAAIAAAAAAAAEEEYEAAAAGAAATGAAAAANTTAPAGTAGAASCVAPSFLAGTVAAPTADLDWPGCHVPGVTKVAWFGERCGGYMGAARWVGMYAFYAANSSLVAGCVRYRPRSDADPAAARDFGGCGTPPAVAPALPALLCSEPTLVRKGSPTPCVSASSAASLSSSLEATAQLDAPVKCGGASTRAAVFRGIRCGPGQRWVRWSSVTLPEGGKGCRFSRSATDLRWNAQWLGQCGVPPQFSLGLPSRVCAEARVAPSPSPPPPSSSDPPAQSPLLEAGPAPAPVAPPPPPPAGPLDGASVPKAARRLARAALLPGETVRNDMRRMGVVEAGAVPDFANLGVAVAVVDTGVDRRHPDLNVVGGRCLVANDARRDPFEDGLGHGTHVAGTIGAKNNGQGIVGVAPGVPIYSLKVLASDGTGTTSDLLKAYEWLYYNARALGIRVVNLSLTGGGGESDPQCEWVAALARQGLTLVAAAGNNRVDLMREAPGACAKSLVVTSYTDRDGAPGGDSPSSFSNYLPAALATDARRRRVVAAPGEDIVSTFPLDKPPNRGGLPQGYGSMSGTSMVSWEWAGFGSTAAFVRHPISFFPQRQDRQPCVIIINSHATGAPPPMSFPFSANNNDNNRPAPTCPAPRCAATPPASAPPRPTPRPSASRRSRAQRLKGRRRSASTATRSRAPTPTSTMATRSARRAGDGRVVWDSDAGEQ